MSYMFSTADEITLKKIERNNLILECLELKSKYAKKEILIRKRQIDIVVEKSNLIKKINTYEHQQISFCDEDRAVMINELYIQIADIPAPFVDDLVKDMERIDETYRLKQVEIARLNSEIPTVYLSYNVKFNASGNDSCRSIS